jgi:hypothetical protein
MKRDDDPIALLRALDPADEKELDGLVAGLEARGAYASSVAPPAAAKWHSRRVPLGRLRLALVAAAAIAAAVVVVALAANPFSQSGTISSAEAKAQVATALELTGNWHVAQTIQNTIAEASATPRFDQTLTVDSWHAADGRLLVRYSDRGGSGLTLTSLYAAGEARLYDSLARKLTIQSFALPADLRDQKRRYLPATAANLYDAAYRVGKVRLAGIEKLGGRRVYRLAFDWAGTSYTLIFDAGRHVPISSESRLPNAGNKVLITRTIYTAYERIEPGPQLHRRLQLPPIPPGAKVVRKAPFVISLPIQDASAAAVMRALVAQSLGSFPADVAVSRARWVLVRRFPGGGVFAAAIIPSKSATGDPCFAYIEIAHPGGAARPVSGGCPSGVGVQPSQDGKRMLVSGFTQATGIELRFARGARVRPALREGVVLATPPIRLFQHAVSIRRTYPHGVVRWEPLTFFAGFGPFPGWLTG